MKKETPTQVFSCLFCEIFVYFSNERLLLSMKGTKNYYIVESLVNMTVH